MMHIPQVTAEILGIRAAGAVARRVDRSHISRDGLAVIADLAADLLNDVSPVAQEVVV